MKKKVLLVIFMVFSFGLYANGNIIDMLDGKDFKGVNLKNVETPTDYELSVINFILKNTNEINIHQMRGEKDNKVYVSEDGHSETVVNLSNKEVVKNYNKGTPNRYSNLESPIKHFAYDTLLWLKYGVSPNDITDTNERLQYYILDLNFGIQAYIFNENDEFPAISFDALSEKEKNVYKFFKFLIFNEKYKVKLNYKTKKLYRESGEEYLKYLQQMLDLILK
ncbi:hypothetical protein [Oceanivirga salmonicida]|uniref:hypothetical protein n=1 Tax=Oceanivirga salmonicida TaxID=1769291 RepID=UPI0012E2C96C|nr:hypothetical protein [Oceanivirga salmonicida]